MAMTSFLQLKQLNIGNTSAVSSSVRCSLVRCTTGAPLTLLTPTSRENCLHRPSPCAHNLSSNPTLLRFSGFAAHDSSCDSQLHEACPMSIALQSFIFSIFSVALIFAFPSCARAGTKSWTLTKFRLQGFVVILRCKLKSTRSGILEKSSNMRVLGVISRPTTF